MIEWGQEVIFMSYIGCHLSSTKGNYEMVKTARKIGADTFAFFTRNPRGSKAKPVMRRIAGRPWRHCRNSDSGRWWPMAPIP